MTESPVKLELVSNSGTRVFSATVVSTEPLSVGGVEGVKAKVAIKNPRYDKDRSDLSPRIDLVTKQYNSRSLLNDAINTYRVLRKKGFPVPGTTRMYEDETGLYLAMTDITEGGDNLVWGFNSKPHISEKTDLKRMNLTPEEIDEIGEKIDHLCEHGADSKVAIALYNYHIVKNKESGKISIVLLDVDSSLLYRGETSQDKEDLLDFNMEGKTRFISHLNRALNS